MKKLIDINDKETAKKFLDIVNTIIVAIDLKGNISLINKKGCKVLGYKEKELIGKNWFDTCLPKNEIKIVRSVFQRITKKEDKHLKHYTNEVKTKKGKIRLINWHNSVIKDKNGKIIGTLSSGEDITEKKRSEYTLRENEEKFRQMAEKIQDVFWITDWNTKKTIYASPSYEKIWGRSLKDLYSGKVEWSDAISSEHKKRALKLFLELSGGKTYDQEYKIIRPDKSFRWIRDRGYPVKNNNGKIYRVVGIAQDITKQKLIEQKINESERKFSSLFNSSRDAIMLLDPPEFKFAACNRSTLELFKVRSEEEFKKLGPWNLSPKNQPDGTPSNIKAKKMIKKAMKEGSNSFEWTHMTKNGKEFPATVLLTRVEIGNKKTLQATVRDITERKLAEQKIIEASNQWETSFDAIGDLISIHDTEYNIIKANKAFLDTFKISQEDLKGKKCFNVVHKSNKIWRLCPFEESIKKGQTVVKEFYEPSLKIQVEVTSSPIISKKGDINGAVHIIKNITERKKSEEDLKRRSEELERFTKFAIGRELKMVELKKKIKQLTEKLNKGKLTNDNQDE